MEPKNEMSVLPLDHAQCPYRGDEDQLIVFDEWWEGDTVPPSARFDYQNPWVWDKRWPLDWAMRPPQVTWREKCRPFCWSQDPLRRIYYNVTATRTDGTGNHLEELNACVSCDEKLKDSARAACVTSLLNYMKENPKT